MRAEFVNPFLASLMNVLKTMASLELKPQKPRVKKDEIARGDVSGLIGMVGPQSRGSMSITFDEGLALQIMENMLGERPNGLNEEVTDMVGEITNMVTGGAKRILAESGFDFDALATLPDTDAMQALTAMPGIGPWTAQVYVMFCLGRRDVFPEGDLALQESARALFDLPVRPSPRELAELAALWSPSRSVAARLLFAYYRILKQREGLS